MRSAGSSRGSHFFFSAAAGALAVAALAVGGCGNSSNSSSGSASGGDGGGARQLAPLTVLSSPLADFSVGWVAEAAGLFKKQGLDVTFNPALGTTENALLASGKVDIVSFPPPTVMLAAAQGEDIKIIYGLESNTGAALTSKADIPSVKALQGVKNCRMGTTNQGTLAYSLAKRFVAAYHLNCQLIITTPPVIMSSLASGSYDAGVTTFGSAYAVGVGTAKSKLHMLVNPEQFNSQFGGTGQYPQAVYFGLAKTLDAKRASVVAFIKALKQANDMIKQAGNDDKVANLLASLAAWKGIPLDVIKQNMSITRPFLGSESPPGFISTDAWTKGLQAYKGWGVPNFDPSASTNQYGERVDMSFYNAASK